VENQEIVLEKRKLTQHLVGKDLGAAEGIG
jgi:hypothetical protein